MQLNSALKTYLEDLGLSTEAKADLAFVAELQTKHIAKYSFNNLAVVNGAGISLDLNHLVQKIVINGLGGYCFEHNKLNFETLKALGLDVRLLMAKVLKKDLPDTPRTHRLTLLNFDGAPYIVDVGFGGNGPQTPLILEPDLHQTSGINTFRLIANANNEYELQIQQLGEFVSTYVFDLAHYTDADCEAANFYTEKYPASNFLNNLIFTLKNTHQTVALRNHELIIRNASEQKVQIVKSADELRQIVMAHFQITLDKETANSLYARFLADNILKLGA